MTDWRLVTRDMTLKSGDWRLEIEKLDIGDWRMETLEQGLE